jgi:signal transduction histidine kinase
VWNPTAATLSFEILSMWWENDIPDNAISPEARHHLFLIAKEAMNNVLKHSEATRVQLTTRVRDGCLELVIEDNGRRFSVSEAAESEEWCEPIQPSSERM